MGYRKQDTFCVIWNKPVATLGGMQACLRDARSNGKADEKKRGGLIGCFRPKKSSKLASDEELDKAAQYVVARFGAYEDESDEDDAEEEGAEELDTKVSLLAYVTVLCGRCLSAAQTSRPIYFSSMLMAQALPQCMSE